MKFLDTGFSGLQVVEPNVFSDERGYFMESFNSVAFRQAGFVFTPVQDNESKSVKGVIRGLHYQLNPFAQAKLIRVIEGTVYDVAVDLRKNSPTFGKWFGIELSGETRQQLFIPRGFAHGFSVLSPVAVIQYKCDNHYNPRAERGISIYDPALDIDWKTSHENAIVSSKDKTAPLFADAEMNF